MMPKSILEGVPGEAWGELFGGFGAFKGILGSPCVAWPSLWLSGGTFVQFSVLSHNLWKPLGRIWGRAQADLRVVGLGSF